MSIDKELNVSYSSNTSQDYTINLEINSAETIEPLGDISTVTLADSIYTDSETTTTFDYVQGGETLSIDAMTPEEKIAYKYAEDRIISDFKRYIDKTYGAHYQTENNVQAFDAWIALGDATPTFRNTAVKYLWRYGKKNSNDKEDLLKTLHYTLMCLYNDHYKDVK